jgi:hypothetical protein
MQVSVVIPTYNRAVLLNKLIDSLPNDIDRIIINDDNLSLAQKRNLGFSYSVGEFVLFIDDDNYLQKGAIDALVSAFNDDCIGIVGMVALYANKKEYIADGGSNRILITGFTTGINTNKDIKQIIEPYEVDEVANAFMVRRDLFLKLGGFDEKTFPIDLDEADLCLRARKLGYKVIVSPEAITYHDSITYSCFPDFRREKSAFYMGRNRVLFQRKHLNKLSLVVYAVAFLPLFITSYVGCLLIRRKFNMIYFFIKGVWHGIRNKKENIY